MIRIRTTTTTDISNFEKLKEELGYWQFFYNWQRPHSALNGKTPYQVDSELSKKTPLREEVEGLYDITKEHVQNPVYQYELAIKKLKGYL